MEPSDRLNIRLNADYHDVDEDGSILRGANTVALPLPTGVVFFAQETLDDDFFVGNETGDVDHVQTQEEFNINATISYDLGNVDFTSVTSYREQEVFLTFQQTNQTSVEIAQDAELFAQEFRLSGDAFEDRLNWQTGFFYSTEQGEDDDILVTTPAFAPFLGPGQNEVTASDNESWAIFAQGSFDITENLSLTGGLRYTDESREVRDLEVGAPILEAQASFDAISWLVSLDYQPNDNILLYGSIARGFRSGGIDQGNLALTINPEFVLNYEVGIKSDWFDNRLRLNASGFYSDYTDIQRVVFDVPNFPDTVIANAAEANIIGFEVELTAEPTDGLTLSGGIGYHDGDFEEFFDGLTDRTDDPFPGEGLQANATIRYEHPISNESTLGFQANYLFRGEQDNASPGAIATGVSPDILVADSYGLLNAQIDLATDLFGGANIALFASNLTDEEYLVDQLVIPLPFGLISNGIVGEPRTYGVRINKSF